VGDITLPYSHLKEDQQDPLPSLVTDVWDECLRSRSADAVHPPSQPGSIREDESYIPPSRRGLPRTSCSHSYHGPGITETVLLSPARAFLQLPVRDELPKHNLLHDAVDNNDTASTAETGTSNATTSSAHVRTWPRLNALIDMVASGFKGVGLVWRSSGGRGHRGGDPGRRGVI